MSVADYAEFHVNWGEFELDVWHLPCDQLLRTLLPEEGLTVATFVEVAQGHVCTVEVSAPLKCEPRRCQQCGAEVHGVNGPPTYLTEDALFLIEHPMPGSTPTWHPCGHPARYDTPPEQA